MTETQAGFQKRRPERQIDAGRLCTFLAAAHPVADRERAELVVRVSDIALDRGEASLWAHAFLRNDAWMLCGPGRASLRLGVRLGFRERLVPQKGLLNDVGHLYISVVTLVELEIGKLRIQRPDTGRGERLRAWLDRHLVPQFLEPTLPVDSAVALKCARLHVPDPRAERDSLIAATAMVHGMAVVTRNVTDFEATGALIVDPWTGA